MKPRYSVVIPLHDEEECIGRTLEELLAALPPNVSVAVGLNACTDDTEQICRTKGVTVGTTAELGYGHGCLAAIDALLESGTVPDAYIFYAGDGANRPGDLLRLIEVYESDPSVKFVMGLRRFRLGQWASEFGRALPNLILGVWCKLMGGRFFHDLGPLRLIERELFERMDLRELSWGWTIEAQIRAAQIGAEIATVPVEERKRTAGAQKVSGVSPFQSLKVGIAIAMAAWRTANTKRAPSVDGTRSTQGS